MGKLLPVILAVIGLGGGVGAGLFLRPATASVEEHAAVECVAPEGSAHDTADGSHEAAPANDDGHGASASDPDPVEADCIDHEDVDAYASSDEGGHGAEETTSVQYVKLSRQFVVPVVQEGKVAALVVMSLSIEVDGASSDSVYLMEPKLRDALLSVMFLHANSGGFDGQFTGGEPMNDLRGSLRQAARSVLGNAVSGVLVTDILRQDV